MTPLDRPYPDIVRDLLTVLTGGTAREQIELGAVPPDTVPLANQPVRRVSHLEGTVELGSERIPYRFTEREFELVGTDRNPDEKVAIRFRPKAKRPAPNSLLTVNYYPVHLPRTPLTDVNAGSVVRTLLETAAREIAVQYAQLREVYDSAFVETAKDASLDKVVALVDVRRLRAGHPVGRVRFARRPNAPGEITIPIGTVVTDGKGKRYLTMAEGTLQPSQPSVELPVHGETEATEPADARTLTVLERAIAGVDSVTNEAPTFRASEAETDDALRTRARRAIHATGRGTLDALRFGLESFAFVRAVTATEYPDPLVPMPGIVRLDVALSQDGAAERLQVDRRIEELRPAGIWVERHWAGAVQVGLRADLRLAAALSDTDLATLKNGVAERLVAEIKALPPGGTLRRARLIAAAMQDARLSDAAITIVADGTPVPGDALTVPADRTAVPADTPVTFGAIAQDGAAAAPGELPLDAEFAIHPIAGEAAAQEAPIRAKLTAFLGAVAAGGFLSFDAVASALRDDARYALDRANCVLVLDRGAQGFAELHDGDPDLTLPAGARATLRNLTVREAAS
ncbi:baseplate J/gp47 family protein [Roseomonas sp. OT10]|uniref:baseplate J/gp47 family protein n=1 Tax=Roseomonas cutis TaxID=2897332 RepID=UPI001E38A0D8|nr:baseplate J/gp47 family protein [Roseomonas sp. OT10]UFN46889.1 baseplate J/gp47 family protein [Roseomonas sp. OT10]